MRYGKALPTTSTYKLHFWRNSSISQSNCISEHIRGYRKPILVCWCNCQPCLAFVLYLSFHSYFPLNTQHRKQVIYIIGCLFKLFILISVCCLFIKRLMFRNTNRASFYYDLGKLGCCYVPCSIRALWNLQFPSILTTEPPSFMTWASWDVATFDVWYECFEICTGSSISIPFNLVGLHIRLFQRD